MTEVTTNQTIEIQGTFGGLLLQPGDADYDEVRRVHNGMIDRQPAVITRCRNTADIVDAVNFARERGLEVAVRGGGHNVAGNAVCEGGMMIDLSLMKGIHVDPEKRTVRAQGGVTWAEFNRETQPHGLAVTGGVISSTGIAGLTLGGGLGWLMGAHGMTCDNLRSVELVTADGSVINVTSDEHPDLDWALRGGGGNFGVAASFEFNLYPVGPIVTGGLVAHPFERARDVLRFFREFTQTIPDELTMFGGVLHAPDGSGMKLAAMILGHSGDDLDAAAEAARPVKEFGPPVMDTIGPIPYTELNSMLDAAFPKGALNYWKSAFLTELSDEAIDTIIEQFESVPSPMTSMLMEHFHGAATRVSPTATAFPHRSVGYNFLTASEWLDPADNDANIAWTRDTFSAMQPHLAARGYSNYFDADETADRVAAAYGPNFERLREIKRRYDPENLFHLNQNIRP